MWATETSMIVRRYPERAAPKFRPKPSCRRFEGPHLVFGDALGPLEVVDGRRRRVGARPPPTPVNTCGMAPARPHLPRIHRGQQGVDFGLVEDVSQGSARVPVGDRENAQPAAARPPCRCRSLSDPPAYFLQQADAWMASRSGHRLSALSPRGARCGFVLHPRVGREFVTTPVAERLPRASANTESNTAMGGVNY